MGDKSTIEWTEATWNVMTGCSKVSQGCKNCYAERIWPRVYGARPFTDVQFHPDRLNMPLTWKRPRMIFVNSLSDFFHESVSSQVLLDVFAVMEKANWHTFQILTKRPERMRAFLHSMSQAWGSDERYQSATKHIWWGVSVEDQRTADSRIPFLLATPALVRFLSVEPQLEEVNIEKFLRCNCGVDPKNDQFAPPWSHAEYCPYRARIHWVICGGESGPKARTFYVSWAESLLEQCREAGVPFFMKQMGSSRIWNDRKGGDPAEWPEHLRVREWPK